MKQQNLSTYGFILVEVTMGVVLFSLLMVLVLQGIGFMAQRIAYVAHHHSSICCAVYTAQQGNEENEELFVQAYTHPSVVWYKIQAQSGNQVVTLYASRRRL